MFRTPERWINSGLDLRSHHSSLWTRHCCWIRNMGLHLACHNNYNRAALHCRRSIQNEAELAQSPIPLPYSTSYVRKEIHLDEATRRPVASRAYPMVIVFREMYSDI